MKCVIFGDESTIPGMLKILGDSVELAILASNRHQAQSMLAKDNKVGKALYVQPMRKTEEYTYFLAKLKASVPDYYFCFSYSMILHHEILDIPRFGAINFHGGLLPQFRGANIYNWVLIEDMRESGMTAHFMTPGIDEGDVICREKVHILESDTAKTLKDKIDPIGFKLLIRIKSRIDQGKPLDAVPQNKERSRYYRCRNPEDGLFNWAMSDREIFNLVRALVSPWPGAFFHNQEGRKIVLRRYHSMEEIRQLRKTNGF